MRASRRRLVVAALLAVALHGLVTLIATRMPRPVPRPGPPVQVAVVEPLSRDTTPQVVVPPPTPPAVPPPVPPKRVKPTEPPPKDDASRPTPSVGPAPQARRTASAADTSPSPESSVPPPAPGGGPRREVGPSLLDRAIAGTTGGPAVSRDTLESALDEPTRPTPLTDDEKARRLAQELATPAPDPRAASEGPRPVVVVTEDKSLSAQLERLGRALDGRKMGTKLEHGTQALVLVRQKDGTLRYETGGFVALILEDGTVRFVDRPDGAGTVGPFRGNGRDWRVNAVGDPTLAEVIPFAIETPTVPIASGVFDLNAPLVRSQGQDPFATEKSCFLDDTRELREELARDARARDTTQAFAVLDRRLEELLTSLSAEDAKREVLALWDDCALDEETGQRARARIERFIAERMPQGSLFGYSNDELAAINESRPQADPFVPYG